MAAIVKKITGTSSPCKLYDGRVEIHGDKKFKELVQRYFKEIELDPIGKKAIAQLKEKNDVLVIKPGKENECIGHEITLKKCKSILVADKTFFHAEGHATLFHELHHYLHVIYNIVIANTEKATLPGYLKDEEQCVITGIRNIDTPCPLGHCENDFEKSKKLPIRQFWTGSQFKTIEFDTKETKRKTGMTRLHDAALAGATRNLEQLLWNGGNPNKLDKLGATPLHHAATIDIEAVQLLIKHGADINAIDNEGKTAIFYAVSFDRVEIIQELLNSQADLDICNEKGNSVFLYAVAKGNYQTVKTLLQAPKLNISATNRDTKESALHVCQDRLIAKWIIERGIDVNMQDKSGKTALHAAVLNQNADMVECLLGKGKADFHIKDSNGLTALDYAKTIEGENGKKIRSLFPLQSN